MKVGGRELQQFFDEEWPGDDWYLEDGPAFTEIAQEAAA